MTKEQTTETKKLSGKQIIIRVLRVILLVMILISLGIYFAGNYLIFFPERYPGGEWDVQGFNLQDHEFTSQQYKIHAWLFPGKENYPTILFCHGNAGNISSRLERMKFLQQRGFAVFIFDYRGYGKSEGSTNEQSIYEDTLAAYDYLEKIKSPGKIVVFGESLGCAASIYLATKRKLDILILEAPFLSITAMSQKAFGFQLPVWMIPSVFPSIDRIKNIEVPTMVIHGSDDEIIPFSHGEQIYLHSPAKVKKLYKIQGGGHNDTYYVAGTKKYFDNVQEFIQSIE